MSVPSPTIARRQREIAEREVALLDVAQAQIQRDGLMSLQMARVAEECGYAIGTLYRHFASKEDLLVALATRNCMSRVELFERAAQWSGPTRERMLAVVLADLLIMREQPEHFRLAQFVWTDMVWGAASAESRRRALEAFAPLSDLIDGIAAEARANGELPASTLPIPALTMGPWMMSVGLQALVQQRDLVDPAVIGHPYRLLIRHLQYLFNGYGWQPLVDAGDDAALDALIDRVSREVFDTDWSSIAPALPCPPSYA
ncbi:helix-turn-helix domain-containing protein [Luteimonas sp. gir]|uniref:TetR/AcrR family transcriptional regulator n=1 Tax=Luteimonas sp. gir TaxID=3127960 RepID=UPI003075E4D3